MTSLAAVLLCTRFLADPGLVLSGKRVYQVLIDGVPATIEASSERNAPSCAFRADNIIDGDSSTAWLADPLDRHPWIRISFQKKVRGRGVGVQFGWRKNWYTFLETEGPFPSRRERSLSVDNKRIGWFQGSLHNESTHRLRPFEYLRSLDLQVSRRDVIPFDFNGEVIELNGAGAISEMKILNYESVSFEYYPESMESLFGFSKNEMLRNAPRVFDFCEIRDTGVYGRLTTLNRSDSVVTLCSPILKRKSNFENFWRVSSSSFRKGAAFFVLSEGNGVREIWLQRFPWETVWYPSEMQDAPIPLEVRSQDWTDGGRYSFPVVRINSNGKIESIRAEDGVKNHAERNENKLLGERGKVGQSSFHRENDTIGVKIGNQTWMRWNLVLSSNDKASVCSGMGIADTGTETRSCFEFGRLYRFDDAVKACPSGWHLPSRLEWIILVSHIRSVNSDVLSLSGASIRLLGVDERMGRVPMAGMDPFAFNAKLLLPEITYDGFKSPQQIQGFFDAREFDELEFQSASPGGFGCPNREETDRSVDQFVHSRYSFALWPSEMPISPKVDTVVCSKLDRQIIERKKFRVRNDLYLPIRCVKNAEKGI